ncbi:MAG TPA: TadE/TadG family type IV pilus assembly protein [Dongiaceae bacterium]|nr:TadE/TadG family type IV pilus assembly protein [Dongiaceae bacterium]
MQEHRTKGQDLQSGQHARVHAGRFLRRLRRDESGATAIEFAFVSTIVVYLMVAIIEYSMAMTVGNSLEAATNLSSRLGKTGYVDEGAQLDQEETILAEVERRVGPMIDIEKVEITHEVYNDFTSLTHPDTIVDLNGNGEIDEEDGDSWTDVDGDGFMDGGEGVGIGGEIVVYKVTYPWSVFTPFISQFVGNDGIIMLSAYSVVKNEPY